MAHIVEKKIILIKSLTHNGGFGISHEQGFKSGFWGADS